ncbi:MAG: hypothetical protein V7K86_05560 [Nostoc sp.]|uniref:hypothetical protein n=1 Tax=Nostoc sp. TaxID=1180 RepID=UPI002FFA91E5
MAINKAGLYSDFFTIGTFERSSFVTYGFVVDARPYKGESWIIRGTDEEFKNLNDMNIKWQMIVQGDKREAKRLARKAYDIYLDFGRFLVTDEDYSEVEKECIKTHDAQGLRMVAALYQGDDKLDYKKRIEKLIKVNGLNKPYENAIKIIENEIMK